MPVTMQTIYLAAAVGGGALLLVQIALSLFGVGDADADVDHDLGHVGEHGDGSGLFSFRAVVAFFTFFGIGGMGAIQAGLSSLATLAVALGSGASAFLVVGVLLLQFYKLRSSGTVDIHNAIGTEGKVYLTVPASGRGEGSVTVEIQGRTMQFTAVTKGGEIKTGALCRVVSVRSNDTLEVESA